MSLTIDKKIIKIEVHRGLPGKGVPKGGTTGQVLAKRSAEDYDTIWSNGGGGGGAFWGNIEGDITEQTDLQTEFEAVEAQIAAKADLSHGHTISDITGLQSALNVKANTADLGTLAAVDDAPADGKQYARKNNTWNEVTGGSGSAAVWGEITGELADQIDLQTALDEKADASHTHNGLYPAGGAAGQVLKKNTGTDYDVIWANESGGGGGSVSWGAILGTLSDQQDLNTALSGKADASHTHTIANVTDLQTALDAKADASDITDLETEIAGKADTSHSHAITDVTDLQTALSGKAAVSHTHTIANVTDLQTALDAKADASHTHAISDVTDLQTALDAKADETEITELEEEIAGKADASHTHAISDVTNLQTALNGKAPSYTYSTTDLTPGTSELATGVLYFVYE